MCKRHIEEETTPEGVIKTTTLLTKCETANATGQICGTQSGTPSAQPSPPVSHASHLSPQFARLDQFPPTPPRSTHSNSDSEQSSRRRSDSHGGSTVYSGTSASYAEVNRSSPTRRERRDSYYDESPQTPLSRSPGRSDEYRESRRSRRGSVASSDRERVSSSHHSRRSSSHSRPRPTSLRVEIVDASPNKPNTRTPRHSRQSSRDGSDTSEDLSHRRREEYYRREEDERVQKEMRAKIARQNQAISSRPPVAPVSAPPSSAPKPRSSTKQDKYRRGSVAFDAQADLNSSLQRLQIKEDKEIRRQKREEEKRAAQEMEAREQRLRDRMNINSKRRTSTVVRPTVTMDNPHYAVPPPPQYQRPRGTR